MTIVTETMTRKTQETKNDLTKAKKPIFQFCGKQFKSHSYHHTQLSKTLKSIFQVRRKNSQQFLITCRLLKVGENKKNA